MLFRKNKALLLAITLALISLLASYFFPPVITDTYFSQVKYGDIPELTLALNRYKDINNKYPSNEEGLTSLVQGARPVIKRILKDTWGNDYIYRTVKDSFDIYSYGPDQLDQKGNYDDIVSWDKKYSCELNYVGCNNLEEYIYAIPGLVFLLSSVLILVIFSTRLFRLIVNSKRINHG